MMRHLVLACATLLVLCCATAASSTPPNVVILLADDLGYGDLGCSGNDTIRTPNIDSLAASGIKFTRAMAGAHICTPSRAALLTGRYAQRMGMATNKARVLVSVAEDGGLPREDTTIAEVLQEAGYDTYLVGKWHLGVGHNGYYLPRHHGFQDFYGIPLTNVNPCGGLNMHTGLPLTWEHYTTGLPHALRRYWGAVGMRIWVPAAAVVFALCLASLAIPALRRRRLHCVLPVLLVCTMVFGFWMQEHITLFHPSACLLYHNERIIEQPMRLQNVTERFTARAVQHIHRSAAANRPFFLYMSYAKVHTALFTAPARTGVSPYGAYADNVEELDWSIGVVRQALREAGVEDNTLVFFSSDHGPWTERGAAAGVSGFSTLPDGTHVPYRGSKGRTLEGGYHVPFLAAWPSRIQPGRVSGTAVTQMDVLPTIAELVGQQMPSDSRPRDGASLVPVFDDASLDEHQDHYQRTPTFFYHCGYELHAVRTGQFKVVWMVQECRDVLICPCTGPHVTVLEEPIIYDLDADPGEMHPLTAQNLSSYGDLVARAAGLREEHLGSMQPKPRQQLGRIPMMHIYATMGCCNFPYCQCCEECDEAGNVPGPYTGSGVSGGGGGGGGGHTPAFEKTMHGKQGGGRGVMVEGESGVGAAGEAEL